MNALTVVTGGTGGLGEATARQLAARGHTVVITARSAESGAAALARTGAARSVVSDLSLMAGVSSVCEQILSLDAPIRALVLNAAVALHEPATTCEGLGVNYATNVAGPLLLAHRLASRVESDGRIVVLGSSQHAKIKSLDFDDLPLRASYTESKLLAMLVALAWSRKSGTPPMAIADPGFVRTQLGRHAKGAFALMLRLTRPIQDDPEAAAATSVWLADTPDAQERNGGYFAKCAPARLSPLAQNPALAERASDQAFAQLNAWL